MKFKVGDRVKVVKDELKPQYVGAVGTIDGNFSGGVHWNNGVAFDNPIGDITGDCFGDDELEFIDVVVIEGVAGSDIFGELFIGSKSLGEHAVFAQGDTVRITVEVLRRAGE